MPELYTPLQVRFGNNPRTGNRDGWRVLTISILLNRTSKGQVENVLPEFFSNFPHAIYGEIASYSPQVHEHMEALLTPLGFGHTRTQRIALFSKEWLDHEDWRNAIGVPCFTGCGIYAVDAWRIFMDQDYSKPSNDKVLERWRSLMREGEVKDDLPVVRST